MTYRPITIAFPSGFILTYRQPILCHCVKEERGASASPTGPAPQGAEQWLPVADFDDRYEVSNEGRVRSLYFDPPRIVTPYTDKDGYPVVALWRNGKRTARNLHRIVAETFHAIKRNILHREVAHLDGTRTNCRADNLKWVSRGENEFQKRAHGTSQAGRGNPNAKLTDDDVRSIRLRALSGERATAISRDFPVGRHGIQKILDGRRWRHVG